MRSPSTLPGWREGTKPRWTTSQPLCGKSPTAGASEFRFGGRNGCGCGGGGGCSRSSRPQPVPAVQRTCPPTHDAGAARPWSPATKGPPHAGALRLLGRSPQRTCNQLLSPSFVYGRPRSSKLRRKFGSLPVPSASLGQKRLVKESLQEVLT